MSDPVTPTLTSPRPPRRRRRVLYALVSAVAFVGVVALILNGWRSYYFNLSPSVSRPGPVILTINHADFRSSEWPIISITNHSQATIYFFHEADICGWYLLDQYRDTDQRWYGWDEPVVCQPPCKPNGPG